MHLAEFFLERHEPLMEACALVIAARGGLGQQEIADVIGGSRQAVQQAEKAALARHRVRALVEVPRDVADLESRVLAALERRGGRTSQELTRLLHVGERSLHQVMEAMLARGEVETGKDHYHNARTWTLTEQARRGARPE